MKFYLNAWLLWVCWFYSQPRGHCFVSVLLFDHFDAIEIIFIIVFVCLDCSVNGYCFWFDVAIDCDIIDENQCFLIGYISNVCFSLQKLPRLLKCSFDLIIIGFACSERPNIDTLSIDFDGEIIQDVHTHNQCQLQ